MATIRTQRRRRRNSFKQRLRRLHRQQERLNAQAPPTVESITEDLEMMTLHTSSGSTGSETQSCDC
ncbi:hypothetical protein PC129_g11275 [Phytophthora cactorum]|uniref:Uncharacterized protein n=1 Tax=Phytophthora cactorum TaxID=29920 RepID=A0A8T1DTK6_9STRA|nr:hypothetical protein Pcac1_g15605 [Phytophthora cactorum]KAG3113938.1 hypothetical protein PI125_g6892 [Phytophthora idaei]KAG2899418.1 hypothetical protein PC114_g13976 [Phytophthora cactorum]KAG2944248.1 hypothetical protein PC117_g9108 [Phytophthora cactorum]KAG3009493.1 hypothetical protein PC119_g13863 [Phytophthora cactorum]